MTLTAQDSSSLSLSKQGTPEFVQETLEFSFLKSSSSFLLSSLLTFLISAHQEHHHKETNFL